MLRESGGLFGLGDYARGLWYLFGPRGLFTKMMPGLVAYLRPDFHPWQADDAAAVTSWLEDNAKYIKHIRTTAPSLDPSVA
jgi:predicted metal-dependent hydrolase